MAITFSIACAMKNLRLLFDNFTLFLLGTVVLATLLPCEGAGAAFFAGTTSVAIGLLFFMHGAKLSTAAIRAGAGHWRLHLTIFFCTFALFPLFGLLIRPLAIPMVGNDLYMGLLYLCALPATVQSAIAFTSIARGNVSAAICSAAASSVLGIFLTPLLVLALIGVQGNHSSLDAIGKIALQLLLPFVAGQACRRWIGNWVERNRSWLRWVDQTSILLVVYTAFSDAVVGGLWRAVPLSNLFGLALICCVLLACILWTTEQLARRLGFNLEDRITILFGGSKKSLATGVPMAQVLFAGGSVGTVILPLMLFHQLQLMVCTVLAQRYARRVDTSEFESPAKTDAPDDNSQRNR